jgi:hypothetical protein
VPRQRRETIKSVRPNLEYSMLLLRDVENLK